MKRIMNLIFVIVFSAGFLISIGCVAKKTTFHISSPAMQEIKNDALSIRVEPAKMKDSNFFSYYKLSLDNYTDEPLEIDWNKSMFVYKGQAQGGFVFKHLNPSDIKAKTIPNTVIPANSDFSMIVAPISRVARSKGSGEDVFEGTAFYPGLLPEGENTLSLVIKYNGKLMTKKLSVRIKEEIQVD